MILLVLACAKPGDASGTLTDQRTLAAVPGVEIELVSDAAPPCSRFVTTTDTDGHFAVSGLCPADSYRVRPSDPTWFIGDSPIISGAVTGTTVALEGWRVPTQEGLWLLDGTELQRLTTNTALDRARIADGSQVRFPTEIPGVLPEILEDRVLVLSGAAVEKWAPYPLEASGRRAFTDRAQEMDPWFYTGPKFTAVVADKTATCPERQTTYYAAGALPTGDYVVSDLESYRALIVRF